MGLLKQQFSTEQTLKALGCSEAFLADLIRFKGAREPLIKPKWPASSSGVKSFYSFENLMVLAIVIWTRKIGLQRFWTKKIIGMANDMRHLGDTENPLSETYIPTDSPTHLEIRASEKLTFFRWTDRRGDSALDYFSHNENDHYKKWTDKELLKEFNTSALTLRLDINMLHLWLKKALNREGFM